MIPVWLLDNEESVLNEHGVFIKGGKIGFKLGNKRVWCSSTIYKYKGWYHRSFDIRLKNQGGGWGANEDDAFRSFDEAVKDGLEYAKRYAERADYKTEADKLIKLIDNFFVSQFKTNKMAAKTASKKPAKKAAKTAPKVKAKKATSATAEA